MIGILAFTHLLVAQNPQLVSIRVFPGGPFESYIRFISPSSGIKGGINVFVERAIKDTGIERLLTYSDGSSKFDPPIPTYFKFGQKGPYGYLLSKLLPEPYCRNQPLMTRQEEGDRVKRLQTSMANNTPPGIEASLRIGNGMNQLGFAIRAHVFFKDMWVNIRYTGNWTPEILDAIGNSIGAKVNKVKGPPDTYVFEPNVEEIRSRALATIEFFSLNDGLRPEDYRERLRYKMIRNCSTGFLKRWIDASQVRDRLAITEVDVAKDVKQYRDVLLEDVAKHSKGALKYPLEDYKSMPVFVDLTSNLTLAVCIQGPDGRFLFI